MGALGAVFGLPRGDHRCRCVRVRGPRSRWLSTSQTRLARRRTSKPGVEASVVIGRGHLGSGRLEPAGREPSASQVMPFLHRRLGPASRTNHATARGQKNRQPIRRPSRAQPPLRGKRLSYRLNCGDVSVELHDSDVFQCVAGSAPVPAMKPAGLAASEIAVRANIAAASLYPEESMRRRHRVPRAPLAGLAGVAVLVATVVMTANPAAAAAVSTTPSVRRGLAGSAQTASDTPGSARSPR
jgi:hypothetical protein